MNFNNTRYYEILGIETDATLDEIKRAYKDLALKYHPDRNPDPEAIERFKEVSKAYETLKDEDKRKLYDQYGEEGLNFINSGVFGEEGELIALAFSRSIKFFVCLLFILVCVFILGPVFIVVRINGAVDWSWAKTFSPVWIILGISSIILFSIAVKTRTVKTLGSLLTNLMVIVCLAMITSNLDDKSDIKWGLVFIPIYVILVYSLLTNIIPDLKPSNYKSKFQLYGGYSFGYPGYIIRQLLYPLLYIWFFVFLAVKLDDVVSWSWWINAIPIIFFIFLSFVTTIIDNKYQNASRDPEQQYSDNPDEQIGSTPIVCCLCILFIPAMIFIGLLATYLNGNGFSIATVFIPVFILLGILFCACCFVVPCFLCCNPFSQGAFNFPGASDFQDDLLSRVNKRMQKPQKFLEFQAYDPNVHNNQNQNLNSGEDIKIENNNNNNLEEIIILDNRASTQIEIVENNDNNNNTI